MRSIGLNLFALLAAASIAVAQPPATNPVVPPAPVGPLSPVAPQLPVAPGSPVATPPAALPPAQTAPVVDPKLDAHLLEWQKKMGGLTNFRSQFDLVKTDSVFQKARNYSGVVLCMKPNFAILRQDNISDRSDYMAFICNGKSIFEYNGLQKSITEHKLPNAEQGLRPTI